MVVTQHKARDEVGLLLLHCTQLSCSLLGLIDPPSRLLSDCSVALLEFFEVSKLLDDAFPALCLVKLSNLV